MLHQKSWKKLFTKACRDSTRGSGFKLKEGRFRLDIGKKFFTVRVTRCWHRVPRAAVGAPSLEGFKARLEQPGLVAGVPTMSEVGKEMV